MKLYKLCYILFGIIFLLILGLPVLYKNYLFIGINIIFVGIVSFLFYLFRKKINISFKDRPVYFYIIILILLCFVVRLICTLYFNDFIQVSDYLRAYQNSISLDFSANYYRSAVHWLLYPNILHYVFLIFGESQLTLSLFNTIVSCLIVTLIYLITYKISNNKKMSFFISLLYVLLPSSILYISFASPEYIGMLLYCLCILFFILLLQIKDNCKLYKLILLSLLTGVTLSISNFFKGISIILLISILIIFIIDFIKKKFYLKQFLKDIISIIIISVTYIVFNALIYSVCDRITGNNVTRNAMAAYLWVGLDSSNNGTYNERIYEKYNEYLENYDYDFEKVNKIVYSNLKKDITSHYSYYPKLFVNKVAIAFKNDSTIANWLYYSNGEKQKGLFEILYKISDIYYIIMLIFLFVGLYDIFKARLKLEYLFLYIFLLGFTFVILLGEVQGRYKFIIMPFFIILSGYNLYEYFKKIKSIN